MTEEEIITYLKDNRVKGVAFDFMPRKVRDWCGEHRDEKIFNKFVNSGWLTSKITIHCDLDSIYCLSEDYKPKAQFEPHWEEFDIDKDGFFHIKRESNIIYYHWFNWQKFLRENFDNYKNFGGWLFDDKLWCTKVLMTDIADCGLFGSVPKDDKTSVPVTPTKIKFWRYRE